MRTIETYKDKAGEWRWRAWSKGRIVETGAEGYASKRNLMRAVKAKMRARYMLEVPEMKSEAVLPALDPPIKLG